MSTGITRSEIEARHLTLTQSVLEEIEALRRSGQLGDPLTEPRCYVCCEAESRNLVNVLIAKGLTNREIVECCSGVNERRREKQDGRIVNAYGVRYHRRHHFDAQKPSQAAYRKIVERRAEEVSIDHINAIGHAVTPLAVMETTMVKGFENLINAETTVSVKETMDAASRLHEITAREASQRKMADLMYMMDRIISAAQEFVPPDKHEAFLSLVEGRAVGPMQQITESAHQVAPEAVRDFAPKTLRDDDDL